MELKAFAGSAENPDVTRRALGIHPTHEGKSVEEQARMEKGRAEKEKEKSHPSDIT